LKFSFESPILCRFFSLQISLPASNERFQSFIHIGRLRVHGKPIYHREKQTDDEFIPNKITIPSPARQHPRNEPLSASPNSFDQYHRPIKAQFCQQKGTTLYIGIPLALVAGFSLSSCFASDPPSPMATTVKVIGGVSDQKPVWTEPLREIGRYLIPRTQPNLVLHYYFSEPQSVTVLTFVFLSHSGGNLSAVPKISLFSLI